MKNVAAFLRSVIPADPAQLLFLAGTVCLVIGPRLSWWPAGVAIAPDGRGTWLSLGTAQSIANVLRLILLFAGIAGYFVCFWPGERAVRRILVCIYLPTVPALVVLCWRTLYLAAPYRSVLETKVAGGSIWPASMLCKVPALQFCVIGLLLIGFSMARLLAGASSLPLVLAGGSETENGEGDPEAWRRVKILVWVLVGPLFLLSGFITMPVVFFPRFMRFLHEFQFMSIGALLDALIIFGIALSVIGRSVGQLLRGALRSPGEKYTLLAVAFAIGIPVLISTGQYLFVHAQLVRHDVGTLAPPEPGAYFGFPDGWLLVLFFPALFEEIVFRGFLQPRFVRRYGLYRGIFLVGIVWAAFHFPSDFAFSHLDDWGVIQTLGSRLFMGVAVSFVLGWLTLETGSVLAAALAHTFYNVLIYSDPSPEFPGKHLLRLSLWAVLGWILFRYWPVATKGAEEAVPQLVSPEAAP